MLVAEKAVGEENDSLPEEDVTGEDTFVEEDCTTGKLIAFIAFSDGSTLLYVVNFITSLVFAISLLYFIAEEKEKISEEVIEAMVGDDKKDVETTGFV